MGGSPTLVLCASLAYVSFLGFVETVGAQNGTTPASEVSALNSVFRQWNISATSEENHAVEQLSTRRANANAMITTIDQTVCERDNETLGPATYYVTCTKRWAVSNVGSFINSSLDFPPQNFTSTLYKVQLELFQTARMSPGSLRYYRLGLENGNYMVTLQFIEIEIADSTSWPSLGRRVFDVYIQGNRVLKDFDIKKEVNGHSNQAVGRGFTANVSENYLEIHLF